jgi:hypothetical protein
MSHWLKVILSAMVHKGFDKMPPIWFSPNSRGPLFFLKVQHSYLPEIFFFSTASIKARAHQVSYTVGTRGGLPLDYYS